MGKNVTTAVKQATIESAPLLLPPALLFFVLSAVMNNIRKPAEKGCFQAPARTEEGCTYQTGIFRQFGGRRRCVPLHGVRKLVPRRWL